MIESGMNIVRLNMSHGSHKFHATTVANARSAAEICFRKTGFDPCLAIALDTKGPEIRTGRLQGVIVLIKKKPILFCIFCNCNNINQWLRHLNFLKGNLRIF
jgi:pyruvate kinase